MNPLHFKAIEIGHALPERQHCPDNVQLFLYNAALWNAHRIHFDEPYAKEAEGYPGLVIAGPLMGDWLTQCVLEWLGDHGRLVKIAYSNRQAGYIGEVLRVGGRVTSVDTAQRRVEIELHVQNAAGENLTPGTALVEFHHATEPGA